jgi:hypothetical protein
MKHIQKELYILLLSAILIIPAGCNKNEDNPASSDSPVSMVGTWMLTKISIQVNGAAINLTPEQAGTQMTILAKNDGTYQATIIDKTSTTQQSGTWSINGSRITFNLSDGTVQTMDYSIHGNILTVQQSIYIAMLGQNSPATLEYTKQ